MQFMVCLSPSNITFSSRPMKLPKKRDTVNILVGLSMLMESFPSTRTKKMLMRLLLRSLHMIGNLLEWLSPPMDYGTQHCLLRCHRRAVPLCQTQQMELNHLETICPLRKARRAPLNRLSRLIKRLKIIILSSGR